MEKEAFKRNVIQIGILFLGYYLLPYVITEFLGTDDKLSRNVPLLVEVLITLLIIYKLFAVRSVIEIQITEMLKNVMKESSDEVKRKKLSTSIWLLLVVVIISILGFPIVANWVAPKIITILKIVVISFCLFLIYQVWNLFSASPSSGSGGENKT